MCEGASLSALGGFGKHTGLGIGARRGPLGAERALGGGAELCEGTGLGALGRFGKHTGAGLGAGLGARRGPLRAERALGGGAELCEGAGLGALGRDQGSFRGSERASPGRGGSGTEG